MIQTDTKTEITRKEERERCKKIIQFYLDYYSNRLKTLEKIKKDKLLSHNALTLAEQCESIVSVFNNIIKEIDGEQSND